MENESPLPIFLSHLDNLTAVQGRDVTFTCVLENLQSYRVSLYLFIINIIK